MVRADDPFAAVHRSARRRAAGAATAATLAIAAVVGFAWVVPSYAAPPPVRVVVDAAASGLAPLDAAPVAAPAGEQAPVADASAGASVPPASTDGGTQHPTALPTAPAAVVETVAAPPTSPAAESVGPREFDIAVDTSGYQVELDRCLWVRMDVGAVAPIVGAHNTCGGDVVLDMAIGDTVRLTGEGLDGTFVVTDAREARKGQDAFQATEGLQATVILQTCHWEGDGVRLLALLPVGPAD
jgi:hypothetical protein